MKVTYTIILYTSITLFGLLSVQLYGQSKSDTLSYDLFVDDEIIGEMRVIKNMKSDSSYNYVSISSADYRMLFTFHIRFSYSTSFDSKGDYQSSEFSYYLNNNKKESNLIRREGNKFNVYEDGKIKKVIDDPLDHTAMEMYFNEPLEEEWVFSERFCDQFKIEKEGIDNYKIDFPGGCTNHYFYKDGKCFKIKINTLISDMEFRLRKNAPPLYSEK